ncbi:MAG: hypothetical protein ACI4JJ_00400 [Huintestinicola sp.]
MLFKKASRIIPVLGALIIFSSMLTACGNKAETNSSTESAVISGADAPSVSSDNTSSEDTSDEAESSETESLPNSAELRGKSYRVSYDTEKWVDSTYLNDQLGESDSTDLTDFILESKNAEGNFIIINDNNVGATGEFTSENIGAQYEAAVSADESVKFLGCKDIELNGQKGVCIQIEMATGSKMEMWYFWHGTYQTLFTYNTGTAMFDELYPDFIEVLESVEFE